MRVFVAGATGAIGRFLVPELVAVGHEVVGLTRREEKAAALEAAGASAVVCDLFDPDLPARIADAAPDAVIHQVTDLPKHEKLIPFKLLSLNRARTAGTDRLIDAARAAGARHFVAQSVAIDLPGPARRAVEHLERSTLAYPGVVVRYGVFYGPGTWYEQGEPKGPRVHVETAAQRTIELLTAETGAYTVVDGD